MYPRLQMDDIRRDAAPLRIPISLSRSRGTEKGRVKECQAGGTGTFIEAKERQSRSRSQLEAVKRILNKRLNSCFAAKLSRSGIKPPITILNCIFARQLCYDDPSCSAILEIIPRVCGPELVACSTVTVTKCQAALRTLQGFPFFKPTCLCREPHVDPDCNSFLNFVFDHPCSVVEWKDNNPYPEPELLTCNHALNTCTHQKHCNQVFKDFKNNCKVQVDQCKMENREACYESWMQLRVSPMFGCICPHNHIKKRCDKIFSLVNRNPCVVKVIAHPDNSTSYELVESTLENPLIDPKHRDLLTMKISIPGGPFRKKNQSDE
ncbi:uncharacterized protein LOC109856624, partial [Pseudomyrmex gracilis]|uniref:uncharacterized protein LOC109856624 n=1 Tax=Pseudomyrmex gracilis TaxID=219809 RepID=UPI0009954D5A